MPHDLLTENVIPKQAFSYDSDMIHAVDLKAQASKVQQLLCNYVFGDDASWISQLQ